MKKRKGTRFEYDLKDVITMTEGTPPYGQCKIWGNVNDVHFNIGDEDLQRINNITLYAANTVQKVYKFKNTKNTHQYSQDQKIIFWYVDLQPENIQQEIQFRGNTVKEAMEKFHQFVDKGKTLTQDLMVAYYGVPCEELNIQFIHGRFKFPFPVTQYNSDINKYNDNFYQAMLDKSHNSLKIELEDDTVPTNQGFAVFQYIFPAQDSNIQTIKLVGFYGWGIKPNNENKDQSYHLPPKDVSVYEIKD